MNKLSIVFILILNINYIYSYTLDNDINYWNDDSYEYSSEDLSNDDNESNISNVNVCMFAIVNCCKIGDESVNDNCFSSLGCPGPFWDYSPCSKNLVEEALKAVLNYYD